MRFSNLVHGARALAAVTVAAVVAAGCDAQAQNSVANDPDPIMMDDGLHLAEVDVDRTTDQLRDIVQPRPTDPDSTDTALVFNNPRRDTTWVYCIAYDGEGNAVGRVRLRIPGNGVRFAFASDMANGQDFIGSAACAARSRVVPSVFIVGGGLTDAKALTNHGWDQTRIRFPVVATF